MQTKWILGLGICYAVYTLRKSKKDVAKIVERGCIPSSGNFFYPHSFDEDNLFSQVVNNANGKYVVLFGEVKITHFLIIYRVALVKQH